MNRLIFSIFTFAIFLSACGSNPAHNTANNSNRIVPSGVETTETRDVRDFNAVSVANNLTLEITVGPAFSLSATGDSNLVELLTTKVVDGMLTIALEQKFSRDKRVTVKLAMPKLDSLVTEGGSFATVSGIRGDLFKVTAKGATRLKVTGEVKTFEVDAHGATRIEAEGLNVETVNALTAGTANVWVSPSKTLKATTSGFSKVFYTGDPKVEKTTADTSSVEKKTEEK